MLRFAGWGAVGGLVLGGAFATAVSLRWGDVLAVAPSFALASAVCASGSLALARRAVRRESPGDYVDCRSAEPMENEKRKLRGGGG